MAVDPNHVYVEYLGSIWRLTQRRWKQFLRDGANGISPDVFHYGTLVATQCFAATEWERRDYSIELGLLKEALKETPSKAES